MKTQTLRDTIITFMKGCNGGVATLKQIYAAIDKSEYVSNSNTVHDSARAIIYRHPGQLPRPTAKALEVGACNCPVVQRITPPTFGRLALQLKVALYQGTLTRTCTTEIYSVATA